VFTLNDYEASGVITPEQAATLRRAIRDHANIMVAGGTGSGKTTLANALLHEIAQLGERDYLGQQASGRLDPGTCRASGAGGAAPRARSAWPSACG
jgi:ABC-type transport system involved in cytochrome bd biosynthesis fused ATPase/permease subunit